MAARSRFDWMDPAVREIIAVSVFLCALIVTGTVGYILIEGWPWIDGLYFTFITLTTIGFEEIGELSTTGRFFTMGVAVLGIGAVAFIAGRSAQMLLVGRRIREGQMKRQISHMKQHYIICGYGRVGKRIAEELLRSGEKFVAIDRSEEEIALLREARVPFVAGDAEDEEILYRAGLASAKGLILVTPEDSTNVFVSLTARQARKDLFILARANSPNIGKKLLRAGADKAISPDDIGARRMAEVILRPHVDRFIAELFRAESIDRAMDEIAIREGAAIVGKSLAESRFRQEFDVIVVAVIDRSTQEMRFNPSAREAIRAGDILIVLGHPEVIQTLRELYGTPASRP